MKKKKIEYVTKGTCARLIRVTMTENDVIESVTFVSGCAGNTKGVASLAVGMTAKEAIERLSGIRCGMKPTSCPDQLAKALELCLVQEAQED